MRVHCSPIKFGHVASAWPQHVKKSRGSDGKRKTEKEIGKRNQLWEEWHLSYLCYPNTLIDRADHVLLHNGGSMTRRKREYSPSDCAWVIQKLVMNVVWFITRRRLIWTFPFETMKHPYSMDFCFFFLLKIYDARKEGYFILIICSIHDHTDAHCFVKILDGALVETKYEWPKAEGNKVTLCLIYD